jgi:cytochrome c peroxidase
MGLFSTSPFTRSLDGPITRHAMMKTRTLTTLLAAALITAACEEKKVEEKPAAPKGSASTTGAESKGTKIDQAMLAVFAPLPPASTEADKIALGKMLFFENRLSKAQDVSCNSCHALDKSGTDGKKLSEGTKKQPMARNTPTVFAAAAQFKQGWDGRWKDVEEASTVHITDPKIMAMADEKAVATVLASMPEYADAFKKAFPGDKDITLANVGKALGAFQRTLYFPTKWDKYLAGDKTAMSDDELKGLKTFLDTGCQTCHQGPGVGGSLMQKLGLVKPWPDQKDQGAFDTTKQEPDKMMFKVATLRQIEKTGPYLHDGSVDALDKVVTMMADHQLGKQLADDQVKSIVTFLKALTVEPPADAIKAPTLPKSTAKTPKPDLK